MMPTILGVVKNVFYFTLKVCTNGDIALGKEFVEYTPKAFPLPSKTALISPYWADADPRYGGDVYSRITRNRTLLQRISNEGE